MPRKSQTAVSERQETMLGLIAEAAHHCREIEGQFSANPPPELETIIKLHRVLLLKYSLKVATKPDLLKELRELIKPVMDWAALQEKRKLLELAEQKYRDMASANAREQNGDGALRPETLQQIERELRLL